MADRPTETRHPASDGLHSAAPSEVCSRLLSAQQDALGAVGAASAGLIAAAEAAADALRAGGKMAYAGAGSSGLMALADCLELAGTFGIPVRQTPMMFAGGTDALYHMQGAVEDDPDLARADVAGAALGKGDVVICLSASGSTPYTLEVARLAAAQGATIIGLANVKGSALLQAADVPVLLDTGAEVISGSTRMGAATTQKVALNILSVMVGIRLGHVHDGFMVNVVADNAKLIARAARIVASIAGVPVQRAEAALQVTNGAVKPAILLARGLSKDAAFRVLSATGGMIEPALKEIVD